MINPVKSSKFKLPKTIKGLGIQNYGPSGTLFFQSLLDGHKNILSIPALYMLSFYYFWDRFVVNSYSELVDLFLQEHDYWFYPQKAPKTWGLHMMGENADIPLSISREKFNDFLNSVEYRNSFPTRREFIISVYLAYSFAVEREFLDEVYILYPIHSGPKQHIDYFIEDFNDVHILHLIREPIQTIGSSIKHIIYENLLKNPFECCLAQLFCDYMKHWASSYEKERIVYGIYPILKIDGNTEKALRLEDIHYNPQKTMQNLCRWLGIPWDDCLLKSTFNRLQWWNRPESLKVSGFDISVVSFERYRNYFWFLDIIRLNNSIENRKIYWKYTDKNISVVLKLLIMSLLFIPFKAELLSFKYRILNAKQILTQKIMYYNSIFMRWIESKKGVNRKILFLILLLSSFLFSFISFFFVFLLDYFLIRYWLVKGFIYDNSLKKPVSLLMEE